MTNHPQEQQSGFLSEVGKQIFFLLARTIHLLPLRGAYALGHLFGRLSPYISAKQYRRMCADIAISFGETMTEAEMSALARAAAMRLSESLIEFLRLPHMSREAVLRMGRIEGMEHIEHALGHGHGVILLTGHLGNWELAGTLMGLSQYKTTAVARAQNDTGFTDLLNRMRETHGVKIIPMTDIRGCIRVLQRNECLAILGDLNARAPGVFVNFFGRPAATYAGVAYLAHTTGAVVLPGFDERLPDNTHRVVIQPPIPTSHTGDRQHDLLVTMVRVQQVIEQAVRARPADWYWLLQRWRTRPEDVPNPERIPMEHRDLTHEESLEIRNWCADE